MTPTPFSEDIAVTREIVEAGKRLGVDVLDHLLIGQGRWVSVRERRLGLMRLGDGNLLHPESTIQRAKELVCVTARADGH
ncbi:MAG: hypothetical protein AVDCRST_MAG26-3249 [uncultured Chloroflexia bacterium]|uniref:MPN domain-containing protein n=1 Tax=uncultured Chloroflexia bacterium TaxID=1672391 RepID=A0A6J4JJW4_9CHLR|nr:MAG: hypothetical protein AVDCRST_MAG26-3249 [uncultured Chloroflexia bacterium]